MPSADNVAKKNAAGPLRAGGLARRLRAGRFCYVVQSNNSETKDEQ